MTRFERAVQLWSLLIHCASHRQVLSYGRLSRLTGLPPAGLGRVLEPIQSYCILEQLPPLTSLVVDEQSGLPGDGFMGSRDLPGAQAQTFAFDWLNHRVPTPEAFKAAVAELPSLGLSLRELMKDIQGGQCSP